MSTACAVKMENVTKRFGKVVANRAVNLELHEGEILSLLGENGSGTSLMRDKSTFTESRSPSPLPRMLSAMASA